MLVSVEILQISDVRAGANRFSRLVEVKNDNIVTDASHGRETDDSLKRYNARMRAGDELSALAT